MEQEKNKKTPGPWMNEQYLREQVKSSPINVGNGSLSEIDGEQNRIDEAE